jgi:hypothetical protein
VTVKLAQNRFRPYVIVPEGTEPPHGLGLDRYAVPEASIHGLMPG